jgi:hypothetical protein
VPNGAQQYDQLKSAVLGAQANTPGTPLGAFPELSKLYSSAPQLDSIRLGNAAPNYNTGVTVANQQAEARAAAQKLKDLQDASKYRQVAIGDGGYDFYDPAGNKITAAQYAAVTGKSPADILKNSQNPIDIAFAQDYTQLQNYIRDKQNAHNDPDARARAQATEAEVKRLYGIDLAQQSPQQVIATFKAAYPTVYGGPSHGFGQGYDTILPGKSALDNAAVGAIGQ